MTYAQKLIRFFESFKDDWEKSYNNIPSTSNYDDFLSDFGDIERKYTGRPPQEEYKKNIRFTKLVLSSLSSIAREYINSVPAHQIYLYRWNFKDYVEHKGRGRRYPVNTAFKEYLRDIEEFANFWDSHRG